MRKTSGLAATKTFLNTPSTKIRLLHLAMASAVGRRRRSRASAAFVLPGASFGRDRRWRSEGGAVENGRNRPPNNQSAACIRWIRFAAPGIGFTPQNNSAEKMVNNDTNRKYKEVQRQWWPRVAPPCWFSSDCS